MCDNVSQSELKCYDFNNTNKHVSSYAELILRHYTQNYNIIFKKILCKSFMRAEDVTSYFYICKFHKNVGSYVDTLIMLSLILSYFKCLERSYLICKVYAFLKNHYAYSYNTHIILNCFRF